MRVGEMLDERCRVTVSGGKVSSDVRVEFAMALSFACLSHVVAILCDMTHTLLMRQAR